VRGYKNIKVYTMLLAWSMILFHNIIPHNHFEEHAGSCQSLFHGVCTSHDGSGMEGDIIFQGNEDDHICHISTFLFHQLNTDHLIIPINRQTLIKDIPVTGKIALNYNAPVVPDSYQTATSLRGPPVS